MDRRTLGSIGLVLAGAGLYALVDALRASGRAPPGAPDAPHASGVKGPAPGPPHTSRAPDAAPVGPPPTPPLPPPPPPGTHLAGDAPARAAVPPPVARPTPPSPPAAPTPEAPSAADRLLLEAALAMRQESLRIYRELHAAGRVTEGQVDDAELAVIDARHDLGDPDGPAWHRARAGILARQAERAERAAAAGQLPQDDADLASLALELERALAGDPSHYAWTRDAVLAQSARRRRALVEAGRLRPTRALEADLANERRFPALPVRAPTGR